MGYAMIAKNFFISAALPPAAGAGIAGAISKNFTNSEISFLATQQRNNIFMMLMTWIYLYYVF